MLQLLRYLWALPATALALPWVPVAWLSGGKVGIVDGCIEIHGRWVAVFLTRGLLGWGPAAAMTVGHVILGRDQGCLDSCRTHEHVHVQQYERWGPLMLPIYFLASAVLYLRGMDPYLDNPFEREAYAKADEAA